MANRRFLIGDAYDHIFVRHNGAGEIVVYSENSVMCLTEDELETLHNVGMRLFNAARMQEEKASN